MPQHHFQFKQFLIHQDKCAMKVCTDSCLFGAVIDLSNTRSILDIGTGTGLLALMAAQRSDADIYAVEIDPDAAQQAGENFRRSSWGSRLQIFNSNIKDFNPNKKYDVIISNPPFYKNSFSSPTSSRNTAMQQSPQLQHDDLLKSVLRLLNDKGVFHLMLPCFEASKFIEISRDKLFIEKELQVFNYQTDKIPLRQIISFWKYPVLPATSSKIIIYEAPGNYTADFTKLLYPFYLYL